MLTRERFAEISANYGRLRIAVIGDYCLDRYFEVDPTKEELSIETNLPVHNVVRVRAQPGGAGTILNNLAALGIGTIHAVGFRGDDGEGYELHQALTRLANVTTDNLICTPLRRTFTYGKPLVVAEGKPPVELNRLDIKNWTATPFEVESELMERMNQLAPQVDAMILLDQVDQPQTGVVTNRLLEGVAEVVSAHPHLWILADSRTGFAEPPPVCLKMNRAELQRLVKSTSRLMKEEKLLSLDEIPQVAARLASQHGRHVFVTLAEAGMLGAAPDGRVDRAPSVPVRGPIDIVGAGDCVTANLIAALGSKATVAEALHIAGAAASVVIHQLGTTGTAAVQQIADLFTS